MKMWNYSGTMGIESGGKWREVMGDLEHDKDVAGVIISCLFNRKTAKFLILCLAKCTLDDEI